MKKSTKILLITAFSLIFAGAILTIIGIFNGGTATLVWDKKHHKVIPVSDMEKYVCEKTKIDSFTDVDIDADSADVTFIPSDDFYMEYCVYSYTEVNPVKVESDRLVIGDYNSKFIINFDLFSDNTFEDSYIRIYYPAETDFKSLDVDISMGDFDISECNFEKVKVDMDMGDFTVNDCYFGSMDIDLGMGNLKADNCYLGDVKLNLDMGSADLNNVTVSYMDANLDMGDADIRLLPNEDKTYGYALDVDMGEISVNGQSNSKEYKSSGDISIKINCDMGSIKISEK